MQRGSGIGGPAAIAAFQAAFARHRGLSSALAALGFSATAEDASDLARRLGGPSLRAELGRWASALLPDEDEDEDEDEEASSELLEAALDELHRAARDIVAAATAEGSVAIEASPDSAGMVAAGPPPASAAGRGLSYYCAKGPCSRGGWTDSFQAASVTAQPEPEPPEPELLWRSTPGELDWEVDPAELCFLECLGSGTSAEVHRASWHGTDVAVKLLLPREGVPQGHEFQRELAVLPTLRHPHLVLFMGASTVGRPLIVSELCAGGTLFRLLHQRPDVSLVWPQRQKIALDAAKGLGFLHLRRVVHRDVKSLNMLLAAPCSGPSDTVLVKIADFGLSRRLPIQEPAAFATADAAGADEGQLMTAGIGTWQWMAPEVLAGSGYDEKADVYSFGMVLFELLARRVPFDDAGLAPEEVVAGVLRGRRPFLCHVPAGSPGGLKATMQRCWDPSPARRPDFQGMLELLRSGGVLQRGL